MLISLDGISGSGKTELCALLANRYNGEIARVDPHPWDGEEKASDFRDAIKTMSEYRAYLRSLFDEGTYKNSGRSNVMFLENLIRQKVIQSNASFENIPVFIDTFWSEIWNLEEDYWHRYFKVLCEFVRAPDMSIFLKLSCRRAMQRCVARDKTSEIQPEEAELIDKRAGDFCQWAGRHIPCFHVIEAHLPINDVFSAIVTKIEEEGKCPESAISQTPTSSTTEVPGEWAQKQVRSQRRGKTAVSTPSRSQRRTLLEMPKLM